MNDNDLAKAAEDWKRGYNTKQIACRLRPVKCSVPESEVYNRLEQIKRLAYAA